MRNVRLLWLSAVGLVVAGCATHPGASPAQHAPETAATAAPVAAAPAAVPAIVAPEMAAERLGRVRVIQIYSAAAVSLAGGEDSVAYHKRNAATGDAVAVALRDALLARRFDVRAFDVVARPSAALPGADAAEPLLPLYALARELGGGAAAPATTRYATYLHTNSPRLVFFCDLTGRLPAAGGKRAAEPVVLAGFIADTASGDVLWSGRVSTTHANLDAAELRRLANELVRRLPALAPRR